MRNKTRVELIKQRIDDGSYEDPNRPETQNRLAVVADIIVAKLAMEEPNPERN